MQNGAVYSYAEYDYLYNNATKKTILEMEADLNRHAKSIKGHMDRFNFRTMEKSVPDEVVNTIHEFSDLGDALIFILPDVPFPVIQEVLNAT